MAAEILRERNVRFVAKTMSSTCLAAHLSSATVGPLRGDFEIRLWQNSGVDERLQGAALGNADARGVRGKTATRQRS